MINRRVQDIKAEGNYIIIQNAILKRYKAEVYHLDGCPTDRLGNPQNGTVGVKFLQTLMVLRTLEDALATVK